MFFFSASWSFELADLACTCLSGVIIVEIDAGDDSVSFTTLDDFSVCCLGDDLDCVDSNFSADTVFCGDFFVGGLGGVLDSFIALICFGDDLSTLSVD